MFWRKSIFVKMILGVILPVTIVFFVTGELALSQVNRSLLRAADRELTLQSNTVSQQVRMYFDHYVEIVRQMDNNNQFRRLFRMGETTGFQGVDTFFSVKETVRNIHSGDSNVALVWAASLRTGEAFSSANDLLAPSGYDITDRFWYPFAINSTGVVLTEPYLTESHDESTVDTQVVSVMKTVFDDDGTALGVVALDLRLDAVEEVMEAALSAEKEGLVALLTSEGRVISHATTGLADGNSIHQNVSQSVLDALGRRETGRISFQVDGEQYLGFLSPTGENGWSVLTGIPERALLAGYDDLRQSVLMIFNIGLLFLVALCMFVTNSFVHPIQQLNQAAGRIADGNLDVSIDVKREDETGRVAATMTRMTAQLKKYIAYISEITQVLGEIGRGNLIFELEHDYRGEFQKVKTALLEIQQTLSRTMGSINTAAGQVEQGAAQSADVAQSLSQGAMEQSQAVAQLGSALESMSRNIEQSAMGAIKASEDAERVARESEESHKRIEEMMAALGRITDRSGDIESIIKEIEDVAYQTKILSLNASVEAARAGGTAGKSFSVVAEEVGNLSGKCSDLASDMRVLISGTVKTIVHGVRSAKSVGGSFLSSADGVREVANTIVKISQESRQQEEAIVQIVRSVNDITKVVEDNAGMAEEKAASSEELATQARVLYDMVSQFQYSQVRQDEFVPEAEQGTRL